MSGGVSADELRARLWAAREAPAESREPDEPGGPGVPDGAAELAARERILVPFRLFAARDPRVLEGLEPERDWTVPELIELLAKECGLPAWVGTNDAAEWGRCAIDPERTISGLDALAERLRLAVERRSPVLFGTGRPGQLLSFYAPLASALAAAGCPVLTPAAGARVVLRTRFGASPRRLRYVNGVALVHEPGARSLVDAPGAPGVRTRSPLPLRMALSEASAAGGPLPELVVGDHGWVCGAGQLGIEAVGAADARDPAPFVGRVEGKVAAVVPLEAGVRLDSCRPLASYVLNRAFCPGKG